MGLTIYQPSLNDAESTRNAPSSLSASASLPASHRPGPEQLAYLAATSIAEKILEVALEKETLRETMHEIGGILTDIPTQIYPLATMIGDVLEGVQFDASHIQYIRQQIVRGVLPYLNHEDPEIRMLTFRAIARSTLQLPELVPHSLETLRLSQPEQKRDITLIGQVLNFLIHQDLSGLDAAQIRLVGGYLKSDHHPAVRMMAGETLGVIGASALPFLPLLLEIHDELLQREDGPALDSAEAVRRSVIKILPDLLTLKSGIPRDHPLRNSENEIDDVGLGMIESWIQKHPNSK